jgi:hypothetical protein
VTAINPSRLHRVIRDLTLHFRVGSTPYMFRLFVHELAAWWLDEAVYPTMTYEPSNQWFEVGVHSMVFDMVDEEIEKE